MSLATDEIKGLGSSVTLLGESFSKQLADIQSDPSMTAAAKATIVAQLTAQYQANVDSVAQIYGVPIDWDSVEPTIEAAPVSPAAPTPVVPASPAPVSPAAPTPVVPASPAPVSNYTPSYSGGTFNNPNSPWFGGGP